MKIGIAGAGSIVPAFLEAAALVKELEVAAICVRGNSKARMEELADRYGIVRRFLHYEEMLAQKDLDAIYVAVPNHAHYPYAKAALLAGKQVLLEKPFASDRKEGEELARLAKEKGLFLLEAITNQYFPNTHKMKESLEKLGRIKLVSMNYSRYSTRYSAFKEGQSLPSFDPACSGGTVMDLNIYNIYLMFALFGKPRGISYKANLERGIDTSGILTMEYIGFQSVLIAAKDCTAPARVLIQGEKGYLVSDSPTNAVKDFSVVLREGEREDFALNEREERLYYELEAFVSMVKHKDFVRRDKSLALSLEVMGVLDEARRQCKIETGGLA